MKKKLVTVMLSGVLAAGMSAGSVQAATADDASGDLYVFIAASLNNAMEVIQKDFNEEYPDVNILFIALAGVVVPVGQYSREIFKNLGIEDDVNKMEINEGKNVTDVLASVSEGSNEIGIVYATDAASVADKVDIIAEAPAGSLETPVLYPVGLTEDAEASESEAAAADAFLAYLQTDDALKVFEEYGFVPYTAEETADDAEAEATEEAAN